MGAFRNSPRRSTAQDNHILREAPRMGFDPRKLSVPLAMWVRSDLRVSMNGSTVSDWDDSTGNARDFSQATASAQPSLSTGGLGGRPELSFDGSDDHMDGASPFGMITDKDSWTIAMVAGNGWTSSGSGGTWYQGRMMFDSWSVGWPVLGFSVVVGNQPRGGFWAGGSSYPTTVTENITAGEPFILSVVDDAGDMLGRVNGSDGTTYSSAGSIQSTASGFTLGKGADLVAGQWTFWNAGISEFLVFDGALDEVEIEALESYLGDRYGIHV